MRSGTEVPVRLLGERSLEVCPMPQAKGNEEPSPLWDYYALKLELGYVSRAETFLGSSLSYCVRCRGTEWFPKAKVQPSEVQDSLVSWLP